MGGCIFAVTAMHDMQADNFSPFSVKDGLMIDVENFSIFVARSGLLRLAVRAADAGELGDQGVSGHRGVFFSSDFGPCMQPRVPSEAA